MGRKKNRHHRFSPSNRIRNTQRMTIGSGSSSVLPGYLAVSARNFQLGRHHFVGARPFICITNVFFLGGGTGPQKKIPGPVQFNQIRHSVRLYWQIVKLLPIFFFFFLKNTRSGAAIFRRVPYNILQSSIKVPIGENRGPTVPVIKEIAAR